MTFAQWSTCKCYLFYGLTSLFAGNRFALTMYAAKTRGPRKRERIEGPWSESHNSWRAEWRNLGPWRCVLCQEYSTERKSFTIVDSQSEVLRPEPWPGVAPLYSDSFSSMYRNTAYWLLQYISRQKASCHSLAFTIFTRKRDRKKSLGQTHLFNIWTIGAMDRTSGKPRVKKSRLRSIFFNNWTTKQLMSLNTVVIVNKLTDSGSGHYLFWPRGLAPLPAASRRPGEGPTPGECPHC